MGAWAVSWAVEAAVRPAPSMPKTERVRVERSHQSRSLTFASNLTRVEFVGCDDLLVYKRAGRADTTAGEQIIQ
jgi:hypothetical protein